MYRRILIIEQTHGMLAEYREWLSLIGYDVSRADSLWEAEQYLEAHRYHAVIYDIDEVGSRSIDFLREHWLQFKIEGTRVAVISRSDQYRDACESMGIPFFSRPIHLRELEPVIGGSAHTEIRPVSPRPAPVYIQPAS